MNSNRTIDDRTQDLRKACTMRLITRSREHGLPIHLPLYTQNNGGNEEYFVFEGDLPATWFNEADITVDRRKTIILEAEDAQ